MELRIGHVSIEHRVKRMNKEYQHSQRDYFRHDQAPKDGPEAGMETIQQGNKVTSHRGELRGPKDVVCAGVE